MYISKRHTILVACILGILIGMVTMLGWHGNQPAYAVDNASIVKADRGALLSIQNAFTSIAEDVKPSVVYITAERTVNMPSMPDFEDLFRNFPFGGPGGGMPRGEQKQHAMASGSGVIVRSDGYILTNDHVVAGADRVTVKLADGRELAGKVTRDARHDLAVIKIEAKNLSAAKLGNSDRVKVGQWAIAFGSPFRLFNTMTVGVVSAITRDAAVPDPDMPTGGRMYPDLIQTDASINPGNSGGPLVNIDGEVIGINTMIESPSGANAGIGFAIPANTCKLAMDQLISTGKAVYGFLGLVPGDINPAKAKALGTESGALVTSVSEGTPADRAGIKAMDVIVEIDGKKIPDAISLRRTVEAIKPDTKIPVVLLREKKRQTVTVTVGSTADDQASVGGETKAKVGISVQALTPEIADRLGIDAKTPGVMVKSVDDDSAASRANPPIRPGDVILKVNFQPTKTVAEFNKAISTLKSGDTALILVQRKDGTMICEMTLD